MTTRNDGFVLIGYVGSRADIPGMGRQRQLKAHTDASLHIKCPHCALSVDLPPSLWSEDLAACERCGYEADLRPDPRVVIEQLRVAAKLLVIRAEALATVPTSVLSSRERWRVWAAARRVRSIVEDLDAP